MKRGYRASSPLYGARPHRRRLFDIQPEIVAYDLHPKYLSTKWALEQEGVHLMGIQHHHAHVASCLVDNGEEGPAIGVAFDDLGYGTDGTMWGGEFLVAGLTCFERVGHLCRLAMPGGATVVREPWRMAVVYLEAVFGRDVPPLAIIHLHQERWGAVLQMAPSGLHSPLTSSVGRLFDVVTALLGVRDQVS